VADILKVAVLTLTRDRLAYTKRAFAALRRNAGCPYDHFVVDQGSEDGTAAWLRDYQPKGLWLLGGNIGIFRGVNLILETVCTRGYDVIVKFDNDCEPRTAGVLADVARASYELQAVLSPRITGLNNPVPLLSVEQHGAWTVERTTMVGGIFSAVPAGFYDGWHRSLPADTVPGWGGDDSLVCAKARERQMIIGYLAEHHAAHIDTTRGQWARYPEYFARTLAEGKPKL
jgi:hypothetical protein